MKKQNAERSRLEPQVDYRQFRLNRIHEPEYRHLWWLLFWPIYWLRYPLIENLDAGRQFHPIACPLDDLIPFQEWFLIPYALWMVSLLAMCLYTLVYDVASFVRYSKYMTVAMTISTVIMLVFPSCQELRPAEMPRDNVLTRIVEVLYAMDTNTNVFPSEHAIGAMVLWVTAFQTRGLKTPGKLSAITVLVVLICASTVFLKQHSVLDIVAAAAVCLAAYPISRRLGSGQGANWRLRKPKKLGAAH